MLKICTKQRFFQTVQSKTCQNDTGKPWIGANLQNVQARQKENLEHKTMQSKWIPTKQIYRSCWCVKPRKSKIKTEMASEIVEERSCSDAYSGLFIVPHNDSGPPTEEQNVKSLGVFFNFGWWGKFPLHPVRVLCFPLRVHLLEGWLILSQSPRIRLSFIPIFHM